MGQLTLDKIKEARDAGYTDQQIADAFRSKLSANKVEGTAIESFLDEHGLIPKTTPDQILSGAASMEPGEQYTAQRFFNPLSFGSVDTPAVMTGAAVPEPGELVQPGQPTAFTRQAGPAMADLLLSLAAKRPIQAFTGPSIASKLLAGATRAGVSGVGSGAGELATQQLLGEQLNLEDVKNQAILGAGTNALFSTIGGLIEPVANFFKNNTARAQGAITKIKDKILRDTSQRAERFVNEMAPEALQGQTNALNDVSLKMQAAMDETRGEYDAYRNAVKNHFEKTGEIDLQNTFDYLEKIREEVANRQPTGATLKEPKLDPVTGEPVVMDRVAKDVALKRAFNFTPRSLQGRVLDDILASARNGEPVEPGAVLDLMATVFKKGKGSAWENLTSREQGYLEGLKEAVKKDLDYIPVEGVEGATAKTVKEAADENFKALKRYQAVLDIYNSSTHKDQLGQTYLRPADFAKKVYANERRFSEDDILKEIWPKLKQEADDYVAVVKELTSDKFNPNNAITGQWTDKIPFAPKLGEMSAYALLDPTTRATIQNVVKQMGPMPQMGLTLGTKVLGQELGVTNPQEGIYADQNPMAEVLNMLNKASNRPYRGF